MKLKDLEAALRNIQRQPIDDLVVCQYASGNTIDLHVGKFPSKPQIGDVVVVGTSRATVVGYKQINGVHVDPSLFW